MSDHSEINIEHDTIQDVVHVTFGDGEPSLSFPVNDDIVLKVGICSRKVVGFELLEPGKRGIFSVMFSFSNGLEGAIRKVDNLETSIEKVGSQIMEALSKVKDRLEQSA